LQAAKAEEKLAESLLPGETKERAIAARPTTVSPLSRKAAHAAIAADRAQAELRDWYISRGFRAPEHLRGSTGLLIEDSDL
jgi:hypothetical protein